jgi:hypothetical protein
MKRLCALAATALAACGLIGVSSASAATEIGSGCQATEVFPFGSLVSVAHGAGSPLPVAAPTSGVLTEWKLNLNLTGITPTEEAKAANAFTQQLLVLKPAGTNVYTVVGKSESTPGMKFQGVNSYQARVPIQPGDVLGLGGSFTFVCEPPDPAETASLVLGTPPLGSTIKTEPPSPEAQVPVTAKIEPDVDGDGYGDETQDKCPQSAAYQTACPVITLSSLPTVGSKAVTVYVSSSLSAPVGVTATVALPKGQTATLTAASQTVGPGSLTPFTLTLTSQVTKALKALPTKKTLAVSITASANNITGSASTSSTTANLKGQAKPVHKKKKPKPKKHPKK